MARISIGWVLAIAEVRCRFEGKEKYWQ